MRFWTDKLYSSPLFWLLADICTGTSPCLGHPGLMTDDWWPPSTTNHGDWAPGSVRVGYSVSFQWVQWLYSQLNLNRFFDRKNCCKRFFSSLSWNFNGVMLRLTFYFPLTILIWISWSLASVSAMTTCPYQGPGLLSKSPQALNLLQKFRISNIIVWLRIVRYVAQNIS